ncbi:hypothetical protein BLA60_10765 [Actinophytocola xinjiangensis]|uniref:Nucleic acid/nucleotide deaminase of polymorphic system toxin n=1 Tax=Actinophytocola xinjiangensis TaxID=485602 RepID=A0A7Z0WP13_9PSEU|nr:DddA-like double-stranded DNA deaminase toxin [Actinophytocola xinjiangensis]OLF11450.1 hypothetical protein BLA60_10765 [Actinophytocola xinjiangensis]
MALKPAGKTLSSLTGIAVMAAVLWFLLNFVYAPSCGRFACGYEPSWWPRASADSGEACPDSLSGAATDAGWAAARLESIADKKVTTGLAYDQDGTEHSYTSGEKDDHYQRAVKVLREVGAKPSRGGTYPSASHVEVKVAALMRENAISEMVLVINHPGGVCSAGYGLSCSEVLSSVLPVGARLIVWAPPYVEEGRPRVIEGAAP